MRGYPHTHDKQYIEPQTGKKLLEGSNWCSGAPSKANDAHVREVSKDFNWNAHAKNDGKIEPSDLMICQGFFDLRTHQCRTYQDLHRRVEHGIVRKPRPPSLQGVRRQKGPGARYDHEPGNPLEGKAHEGSGT